MKSHMAPIAVLKVNSHATSSAVEQLIHSLADYNASQKCNNPADMEVLVNRDWYYQGEGPWVPTLKGKVITQDIARTIKTSLHSKYLENWKRRSQAHEFPDSSSGYNFDPAWIQTFKIAARVMTNPQFLILVSIATNTMNTLTISARMSKAAGPVLCPCGRNADCTRHFIVCSLNAGARRCRSSQWISFLESVSLSNRSSDGPRLARRLFRDATHSDLLHFFTGRYSTLLSKVSSAFSLSHVKRQVLLSSSMPFVGRFLEDAYCQAANWRPLPIVPILFSR